MGQSTWKYLAVGSAALTLIPFVLSHASVGEFSVGGLAAPGWVVAAVIVAGAAIFNLRRWRVSPPPSRAGQEISPLVPAPRLTPRELPVNPFVDLSDPKQLGRRMENAAAASAEFGKTLGVVYFELGRKARGENAADYDQSVADLTLRLQGALRGTDHVARWDGNSIVACIGLLPGRAELETIARRLRRFGSENERFGAAFDRQPGLAVHEFSGRGGEDLIAEARADYKNRLAELGGKTPNVKAIGKPKRAESAPRRNSPSLRAVKKDETREHASYDISL